MFECVLSVVAFDCFTLIGNNLTDTHYRRCLCHRVVSTDDLIQTLITVKHTHRERKELMLNYSDAKRKSPLV